MQEHAEEGLEDDLGVGGAAAEDAEAEFIRNVCEKDIVTGTMACILQSQKPFSFIHSFIHSFIYSFDNIYAGLNRCILKYAFQPDLPKQKLINKR